MDLDEGLKVNAPQVVHETIDGETILLNLDIGAYFSLNATGALVWAMIEKNYTKRAILEKVSSHFNSTAEKLEDPISDFLDELIHEGLVVPDKNGCHQHDDAHNARLPDGLGNQNSCYSAPVLHKYTDMQDLLLLDPIHDVDDAGWPAMKAD